MSISNPVDLSKLPAPAVVEALDFETIFAGMVADLRARWPEFDNLTDADPTYKVLQVAAYRELVIRQRVNDSAQAVMLAKATGPDLDHMVAREPYNITRLLIDAGDPDAVPPVDPTWEDDEALRRRAQLAPSRFSTAGPEDAYVFFALGADPRVLDATCDSPAPGEIVVNVLSREGDGEASPELLAVVLASLSAKDVRPFTDQVSVRSAEIVPYTVEAALTLYDGPDAEVVLQTAKDRAQAYATKLRRLGLDVSRSGFDAALHCEGVQDVALVSPAAKLVIATHQVAVCTDMTITLAGRDE